MRRVLVALVLSCTPPAPLLPVPVIAPHGFDDIGARQAREERKAQTATMARALGRAAAEAARRNDCDTVRRLERSFLALPPPDNGKPYDDRFVTDPGIQRCLGVLACREMQAWLRDEPQLGLEPRVQARMAKCPPQPALHVKTQHERCLEIRSEALLRAQRIPDPKDRGRALREVVVCPPDVVAPSP